MDDKKNSNAPEDDMVKPVSSTNSSESVEAKDESSPLVKGKYPKIVFLIIINEFCERFSFYGFRTVLFFFLTKFIGFDETTATSLYHGFAVVCYFTPLLGAILADGYIGLYKTIVYLSLFYAAGEIVLTLTSMGPLGAPSAIGPLIGLLMIGIGTGGNVYVYEIFPSKLIIKLSIIYIYL
jgi:solute carrier family 15 oligopeptide transporter 1